MTAYPDRLKTAIHVARERAGIPSDMQLAQRAGVSYDTLMNWYGGRTTPRPNELKKVADAANTTLVALMDAYEGRDPEPPTLVEAIYELVAEMRAARMAQGQPPEEGRQSDASPTGSGASEGVLDDPEPSGGGPVAAAAPA